MAAKQLQAPYEPLMSNPMANIDVFNGDADGICALHQWRLAYPAQAALVTGIKRDIALLARVDAHAGDIVSVFDVSFDVNRAAVMQLLDNGVSVIYFDHHGSGSVPMHLHLHARIDITADACAGTIVNDELGGRYRTWAIVAAFGDNLRHTALQLARDSGLNLKQTFVLQELGQCINYNAYGDKESDLVFPPADVYNEIKQYFDPFEFIAQTSMLPIMRKTRCQDVELARHIAPHAEFQQGVVIVLPDTDWARRVRGTYANLLTMREPGRAHAVLSGNAHTGYTVSVRAPLTNLKGADHLCSQFPSGGGRRAAAGINLLPGQQLDGFVHAFEKAFAGR